MLLFFRKLIITQEALRAFIYLLFHNYLWDTNDVEQAAASQHENVFLLNFSVNYK
jgi:hypothetical protein